MGKKHSKEDSAIRNQRKADKAITNKRKHVRARCRFIIKQMHETGKNQGFVAWLGWKKDQEEPVVLRANFVRNRRVDYVVLEQFVSDLGAISKSYVNRMTMDNLNKDTPQNIVRTMATVLWNQVQTNTPEPEIDEQVDTE